MNTKRRTVLACVDGSALSQAVVDYGAWVSRTVSNPLKLLHNIPHGVVPPTDLSGNIGLGTREELLKDLTELEAQYSKALMERGKLMLTEALERAQAQQAHEPSKLLLHGSLEDTLIQMEEEIRVLVLGVRGEDHEDRQDAIGAQLESVARSMHRPVLVVNRPFSKPPTDIMFAYDGGGAARNALTTVTTSPLYRGMHFHLVYVSRSGDKDKAGLEEAASRLQDAGLGATTVHLKGEVESALLEYQHNQDIDMTVMGAFGHSRLRELLMGSITMKLLGNSTVPLLLLR